MELKTRFRGVSNSNYSMVLPFLISLVGVLVDYVTTTVGLGLGFYEIHPEYHPVLALTIFWTPTPISTFSCGKSFLIR